MKKPLIKFCLLACITLFVACADSIKLTDNGEVQLPRTIIIADAHSYSRYEYNYDNQNRITKVSRYHNHEYLLNEAELDEIQTFTYIENDLVKVVAESKGSYSIEFSKSEDKISITRKFYDGTIYTTSTMDLNNDGYPSRCESATLGVGYSQVETYQFHEGNLMKHSFEGLYGDVPRDGDYEYIYDNEKSPFFYCETPKWGMIYLNYGISKNNVIKSNGVTYHYEYSDGFPIKCTMKYNNDEEYESVTEYKYN